MDTGIDLGAAAFFAAAAAATAAAAFLVLRAYRKAAGARPRPLWAMGGCLAGALAALGLYVAFGSPGRADAPHAPRLAALMAAAPESLGPLEIIAVEEAKAATDPDNPMPPFVVAAVHEQIGDFEAALVAYDLALRRAARLAADPDTPDAERALLMRAPGGAMSRMAGLITAQNGGVANEQALSLWAAASTLAPNNPEPFVHRAYAAARAGRHEEAEALWTEALARLPPDSPMVAMAQRLRSLAERGEIPGPPPSLNPAEPPPSP
jgi:cytochrome c-type biogenesis protein CcmH/NrfG